MSSNPFLNNRFKNLELESNKNDKNDKNNKSNKKQSYESSNNTFTKNPIIQKKDEFIITDELFPTLTPIMITDNKINNFKDALNQETIEIINSNKITKGWIEIFKVDNKLVYNNERYNNERYNQHFTESNIMDKFVSMMQKKYEKHRTNYDDINGDGAYNETFLTITYDSDSDTEEDEDSSVTEDEWDDYNNYIDDTY